MLEFKKGDRAYIMMGGLNMTLGDLRKVCRSREGSACFIEIKLEVYDDAGSGLIGVFTSDDPESPADHMEVVSMGYWSEDCHGYAVMLVCVNMGEESDRS